MKHKNKQSRPHGHRQQSLSNSGQLPLRPQSAQTLAASDSGSSSLDGGSFWAALSADPPPCPARPLSCLWLEYTLFPRREEGPGSRGMGCEGGERKPFPPGRLLCARSVGRYCHCSHFTEEETGAGLRPELWLQAQVLPHCSHAPTLLGLRGPQRPCFLQRGQIRPESPRAKCSPGVWLPMGAREGHWPGARGLDPLPLPNCKPRVRTHPAPGMGLLSVGRYQSKWMDGWTDGQTDIQGDEVLVVAQALSYV